MLIQEMHNKIELRLQKMGSHAYDWIQGPQLDSYINDNISAYVKNKSNSFSLSGKSPFSKNVKNLDDLKTLVIHGRSIPMKKLDSEAYSCILPSNYEYYIQAQVNTARACNFPDNKFPDTVQITKYALTLNPNIGLFKIMQGSTVLFEKSITQYHSDASASFMLYNEIVTLFDYNSAELYYHPVSNNYTVVSTSNTDLTLLHTVDGVNTVTTVQSFTGTHTYPVYTHTSSFLKNKLSLTNISKFADYLDHPFAKPSYNRPMGIIYSGDETIDHMGSLRVLTDERFILSNVELTYIRTPAKVNLSLNISCDLPAHTHEEIVDKVILDILESIESRRVQSKSALNQLNE